MTLDFLSLAKEAALHREVYTAVLRSLMRTRGSESHLAHNVGFSPQTLSYILHRRDKESRLSSWRYPSPELAERIVRALPLSNEEREFLLKHMVLASERRLDAQVILHQELKQYPLDFVLGELRQAHQQATFAQDFSIAKTQYEAVREETGMLLEKVDARQHPFAFVELCLLRHDVQCVLNRQDDALWHAKMACAILESSVVSGNIQSKERSRHLLLNAVRSEAVAYQNLGLMRNAYDCCTRAEQLDDVLARSTHASYLYQDKLRALAGKSRVTISEAEGLADQARFYYEGTDIYQEDAKYLMRLLTTESLARVYVQQANPKNFKKAERLLRCELDRINEIALAGPLHRCMFLKTYAKLRWKQGDESGWHDMIIDALRIAGEAGLNHQMDEMKAEYGVAIKPILSELLASSVS